MAGKAREMRIKRFCKCGVERYDKDGSPLFAILTDRKGKIKCHACGHVGQLPGYKPSGLDTLVARIRREYQRDRLAAERSIRRVGSIPADAIQQTIAAWVWLVSILMALQIFGFSVGASSTPTKPVSEIRRDEK